MHRTTPEAIEAFITRDYCRLHLALGLRPWQISPLPREEGFGLGVGLGPAPDGTPALWFESWEQAQELRRLLEEASK